MKTLDDRYVDALNRIGHLNLSTLPREIQEILKNTTDFKTKVEMLELVSKYMQAGE